MMIAVQIITLIRMAAKQEASAVSTARSAVSVDAHHHLMCVLLFAACTDRDNCNGVSRPATILALGVAIMTLGARLL